jgi:hypothetical protein
MEQVIHGIVKHISNSVGLEELGLIFSEIRRKNLVPAYHIIDLAIKIDHFREFPQKEALEVYGWQDKDKNYVGLYLVRHLVWEHFYFFPSKFDVKQRVCGKLGIDITPRLMHRKDRKKLRGRTRDK